MKPRTLISWPMVAAFVAAVGFTSTVLGQGKPSEEAAWLAFTRPQPPEATFKYVANGSENQELEIYAPAGLRPAGKLSPVLILVHGGGWTRGTREALAPHARYLAARGWVCVNISYRLTSEPGITLVDAQADVRAALDWVRAQAAERSWDPQRISALGESAGGQLVCALGMLPPDPNRWRVHSLVLFNPVLDLTTLKWALATPGVRGPGKSAHDSAEWASPLFHLTSAAPPILLLHGRKDATVPIAQAEAFAARANSVGAKVDLIVVENAAHAFLLQGYGKPDEIRAALGQIADFLGKP
ncbi:MAG: alpha/beta hydrolase [Opitutaceae bacterium]